MNKIIEQVFIENSFKVTDRPIPLKEDNFFASAKDNINFYIVVFVDGFDKIKNLLDTQSLTGALSNINIFGELAKTALFNGDIRKNSSLILCVEVDNLDLKEEQKNLIFEIEENPYLFKKYVFPYTKKQRDELSDTLSSNHGSLTEFIQERIDHPNKFEIFSKEPYADTEYNLITKLFIKLPFLKLNPRNKKYEELSLIINEEILKREKGDKIPSNSLLGFRDRILKLKLEVNVSSLKDDDFIKALVEDYE